MVTMWRWRRRWGGGGIFKVDFPNCAKLRQGLVNGLVITRYFISRNFRPIPCNFLQKNYFFVYILSCIFLSSANEYAIFSLHYFINIAKIILSDLSILSVVKLPYAQSPNSISCSSKQYRDRYTKCGEDIMIFMHFDKVFAKYPTLDDHWMTNLTFSGLVLHFYDHKYSIFQRYFKQRLKQRHQKIVFSTPGHTVVGCGP